LDDIPNLLKKNEGNEHNLYVRVCHRYDELNVLPEYFNPSGMFEEDELEENVEERKQYRVKHPERDIKRSRFFKEDESDIDSDIDRDIKRSKLFKESDIDSDIDRDIKRSKLFKESYIDRDIKRSKLFKEDESDIDSDIDRDIKEFSRLNKKSDIDYE
jgi:hypothetical protein